MTGAVWVHPAIRLGRPVVGGTRTRVDSVAVSVYIGGVDTAVGEHGLTREQVLTACWYAAVYGVTDVAFDNGRFQHHGGTWRARWGVWAGEQAHVMSEQRWGDVPDPPMLLTTEGES